MKKAITACILLLLTLAFLPLAWAEEGATPKEVFDKISQAAQAISNMGLEAMKDPATQKEFYKEFAWKDTYITVHSCVDKTVLIHPDPKVVGLPIEKIVCKKTGKHILEDYCSNERPEGYWIDYWWTKPGHPPEELFRKILFVIPVPGMPGVQVGAGIYSDDLSLEDMNKEVAHWAAGQ